MPIDIILIVLVLLVFVGLPLIQIRKQNKRVQEIRQFQDQLGPGMVVKTTSGIHGRVVHVGDTTIDLEIAQGVVTTWEKVSILETVDSVEPGSQQETQLTEEKED
ncbi:preprotein translocase subunit YajC [uncultured Corynebacterium sp.]|uniref:preprotein translocase subunit YajC n=1 Tax=uncultured Corynebacterium sp. TaxID=159447 RepID=UPI002601BBFB|nr:preprotein translocase subunit YajC [uncultured Corynebacterium sp.]